MNINHSYQLLYQILACGNQDDKAKLIVELYRPYVAIDDYGNIYLNRNFNVQKPYMVAHIDTVDEQMSSKSLVLDPYQRILSAKRKGKPCNLGADDGVGVYAALKTFDELDIGVALFRDEEVGCIGSSNANPKYLNASYMIQLDRKGGNDVVFTAAGIEIASSDFIDNVSNIATLFDYKHCHSGGLTDVVKRMQTAFATVTPPETF